MVTHRLDTEYSIQDGMQGVSDAEKGAFAVKHILSDLKKNGLSLVHGPTYLGLGVGVASAEKELARLIEANKTIFVDKSDRSRFMPQNLPNFQFIQEGLFTYLGHTNEVADIISAICIEYILENKANFEEFLKLVCKVLKKNGCIYIYPTHTLPQNVAFHTFGLKNVSSIPTSYLILVKE